MAKKRNVSEQPKVVIQKNIPFVRQVRSGKTAVLRALNVGDSFAASAHERLGYSGLFNNLKPRKFSVRKISDNEIRIWRVE